MNKSSEEKYAEVVTAKASAGIIVFESMPAGFFQDIPRAQAADGPQESVLFHFDYTGDIAGLRDSLGNSGIELNDMHALMPEIISQLPYRFAIEIPKGRLSTARQRLMALFKK